MGPIIVINYFNFIADIAVIPKQLQNIMRKTTFILPGILSASDNAVHQLDNSGLLPSDEVDEFIRFNNEERDVCK
jgi:hypothetical protein